MKKSILGYIADCRAVTSIEYGLIVMAVSLAFFAAYFLSGDALREMMSETSSALATISSEIAADLNTIE